MRLKDWLLNDKHGQPVYTEVPNWPIITALVIYIVDRLVDTNLAWLAQIFLAIWATLEIVDGSAPWRRILGASVLIYLGWQLFN